jgi:hypothetical protein
MGHTDGGEVQNRAQMESQSGAPRVVAAGGIHKQYVRGHRKRPDDLFQKWPLPQCQKTRLVGCAGRTDRVGSSNRLLAVQHNRSRPCGIVRAALPLEPPWETDPTSAYHGAGRRTVGGGGE